MSVPRQANVEEQGRPGERRLSKRDVRWNCETYQVVQQLLADDLDHLEGGFGRHRVDKHIAVNADEVLAVHDTVLILYYPLAM